MTRDKSRVEILFITAAHVRILLKKVTAILDSIHSTESLVNSDIFDVIKFWYGF